MKQRAFPQQVKWPRGVRGPCQPPASLLSPPHLWLIPKHPEAGFMKSPIDASSDFSKLSAVKSPSGGDILESGVHEPGTFHKPS